MTADKLYRIAALRMAAAGMEMPCSEAVFCVLSRAKPDAVDYDEIAGLSNADFPPAVFLLLLNRPIDPETQTAWAARAELPAAEFQTAVLRSVLHSAEYEQSMKPLLNCPLPVAAEHAQIHVALAETPMPERLVRIYRKMPRPIKQLAKKIAGKEEP